ncbi:PH domain-containing protein [Liberiplasma polymorphum]|uniref:PH domain-containing protein n=1 Tax=Liberiplasma polymorphum TaxID=3374570 RepID=UPI003774FEB1
MSNFKRQHPITIFTGAIKELKGFIIPIILVAGFSVVGTDLDLFGDYWALLFTLITIGTSALFGSLKWFFFRYSYDEDAITIKSGVMIKKHRYIKKERIQTINLEAGIILRLLGLSSIRIETAGNLDESEVSIDATRLNEAHTIKQLFTENKKVVQSEETLKPEDKMIEVDAIQLFKAGLTSGGFIVVLLFMIFLLGQITAFLPSSTIAYFEDVYARLGVIFLLITLFSVILLSWIASIFKYVIRHAFFTIKKSETDIEITRGLIVKKTLTIKPHRIQAVVLKQGLFRQPFNYVSIEVKVAGGKMEDSLTSTELHPFIKSNQVKDFLKNVLPDIPVNETFIGIPKRAWIRYSVRNLWMYLVLIPLSFFSLYSLWFLVLLPFSILLMMSQFNFAGFYIGEDTLYIRKRVIARQWVITKRKHIQSMHFNRSLFQRIRRLSTVGFTVLAAPKVAVFSLQDIGYDDQKDLYEWLSKKG